MANNNLDETTYQSEVIDKYQNLSESELEVLTDQLNSLIRKDLEWNIVSRFETGLQLKSNTSRSEMGVFGLAMNSYNFEIVFYSEKTEEVHNGHLFHRNTLRGDLHMEWSHPDGGNNGNATGYLVTVERVEEVESMGKVTITKSARVY
jgi:hypothetical protein